MAARGGAIPSRALKLNSAGAVSSDAFVSSCLCGPLTRSVAGEGDLADVDAAEGEAGLAVAEVVAPQAAEAPVEAERRDLRPHRLEAVAPCSHGAHIVDAEAVIREPAQAGARDLAAQVAGGRQHAAGEELALDDVAAVSIDSQAAVVVPVVLKT